MPNAVGDGPTDLLGLRPNRACRHCVNIKAKCVPLGGANICTRCHRLGKQCTTPAPKKRQRNSTNEPNDTQNQSSLPTPTSLGESSLTAHSSSHYNPTARCYPEPQDATTQAFMTRAWTKTAGSVFEISPEIGHAFVTPVHEKLFLQFRNEMANQFPFIMIPATSTATIMRERPFLYCCCVMTAVHRDPPLQSRIARDILKHFSEHVLLYGEKSLDLVQGLLVMAAWYHVYTHNQPQLMNFLHLAKALIVDLGLNRPPGTGIFQIKMATDATHMIHGTDLESRQKHNLEERRVCLAAYHVHSAYSSIFARLDPIAWTGHIDECCRVIEECAEFPSDALAVALVRLDHILERYIGPERLGKSLPALSYVKLFSNDLDNFTSGLPEHLKSDAFLDIHVLSVKISLFSMLVTPDPDTITANKVEALYTCLNTTVAFFEAFYARPTADIPHTPFVSWTQLAHAFDVLAKLSFLQFEGWDLEYVRNIPKRNFSDICDMVVEKCYSVQALEDMEHSTQRATRFEMFGARMESFKQWYASKLEAEAKLKQAEVESSRQIVDALPIGLEMQMPGEFSELLFQDLMRDWPSIYNDMNFV